MTEDEKNVDFVASLGLPFLAHLLRRLSDTMVAGDDRSSKMHGLAVPSRTTSTLLLLKARGSLSVTDIARELRQSHQLVMIWIKQLLGLNLVLVEKDAQDGRRTLVSLSEKGWSQMPLLQLSLEIEERALRSLLKEADADVFEALWRIERALRRNSYAERLQKYAGDFP